MMTARTRFGLAGALLLVLVAAGFASAFAVQRAGLKKLEHSFPAMGTGAAFTFWGAPEKAELAAKNGLRSVAFCCISTGVFRFPQEKAAEIAVETVKRFLEQDDTVEQVIFNVFTDRDLELYRRQLKK